MGGTLDAVRDIEAIFEDLDPAAVRAIVRPVPLLRADALAFLRFERSDLAAQRRFFEDFGLRVVHADETDLFAAGRDGGPWCVHVRRGSAARFLGLGLALADAADLDVARGFPGARDTGSVPRAPGATAVRVADPDGIEVDFVSGWSADRDAAGAPGAFPADHRRNSPRRPPLRPAEVIRLGHLVLQTPDFDRKLDWYMRHAGIIPSDAQVLADGTVNLAFCRLDRGEAPADHHTLAIAGGIGSLYMHSAFEVADADAIGQGQQVLRAGGWRHGWGIGRHFYGSQIFDYWRDPAGALMEHYADGDRYDAHQPIRYSRFTRGSTWMWGQDPPRDFEGVGPREIALMLRNLWRGEIRWSRLKLVLASLKARPRPWMR